MGSQVNSIGSLLPGVQKDWQSIRGHGKHQRAESDWIGWANLLSFVVGHHKQDKLLLLVEFGRLDWLRKLLELITK